MIETTKQEPKISPDSSQGNAHGPTNSTPEVKEELSKVGSSPKRNIFMLGSMILGLVIMVYNLLSPVLFSKKDSTNTPVPTPAAVSAPSTVNADLPPVPQIPEPPKLVEPTPPPAPTPPIEEPTPLPEPPIKTEAAAPAAIDLPLPQPTLPQSLPQALPPTPNIVPPGPQNPQPTNISQSSDETKARIEAKRKSSIILVGGTVNETKSAIETEQNSDFKKRGELAYVLGQGKIIDAVVESAINSDFSGEIRAVVSRDVYSENAKLILIPKGTRVFGTFAADTATGRVTVKWTKMNLESGYTLNMGGVGVDNLGRTGVQGRLDNKYAQQMTNAILTSAFNIGVATGLDRIIPPAASTATAAQTASGVSGIISQATVIASDQNNQTPPNYTVVNIPAGGNDAGATAKINAICALQAQITDQTSSAYTTMGQACITARQTAANPTNAQGALNTLLSSITGLATTAATAAVQSATPTQTQEASKQAFTDVTTAAKKMVENIQFQPTVTIDQGTRIKIYVNKDYVFPKDALNTTKVIH